MKPVIKDLGKVCITPEGDWDIKKEYANLDIVFNRNDGKVYISKQCVPIDIDILNTDYWHLLVDFDSIVNDMTAVEIKNHVDNAIKKYIGDVSDEYNSLEKISNWIVSYVKTTDDKFSELRTHIRNEINLLINGDAAVAIADLAKTVKNGSITFNSLDSDLKLATKVINDLTTTSIFSPLSAYQGVLLKNMIDVINGTEEGSIDYKISKAIDTLVNNVIEELKVADSLTLDAIQRESNARKSTDSVIESNSAAFGSFYANSKKNSVEISYNNINREDETKILIPAATTERAGVMTAEDKNIIDTAPTELLKRIQGTSENSDSALDPFKAYPKAFSSVQDEDFMPILDSMHGESSDIVGNWRMYIGRDHVEIKNTPIHYVTDVWLQVFKGCYRYYASNNRFGIDTSNIQYNIYYRVHKNGVWSVWRNILDDIKDYVAELNGKINVLNGTGDGSVHKAVNTAIANLVGNSPEILDTIQEISEWILNDKTGAAALAKAISENKTAIEAETTRAQEAESGLSDYITTVDEDYAEKIIEIKSKALHYNTLHATTSSQDVEIYGKSVDGNNLLTFSIPAVTTERAGVMTVEDKKEQVKMTPLVNGDIIVGQAREIHSRNGKNVTDSFLARTTAGSGTIGDGVATLKSVGGNIVKNLQSINGADNPYSDFCSLKKENGLLVITRTHDGAIGAMFTTNYIVGHTYYCFYVIHCSIDGKIKIAVSDSNITQNVSTGWNFVSYMTAYATENTTQRYLLYTSDNNIERLVISNCVFIDLTEMFGAGNEPDKDTCDKLFGAMDALPQGLTIAQPTGLKSTGYNQWNPTNVLLNKSIVDNAIEDDVANRHIAIVECLPCKMGRGENNGYIIGYGEGDNWNVTDIEVYFSPLNPMEVEGELYMHKLEMDSDYGTFVPECKGYLLIVTPTIDKLCVHLYWSGDREFTDYEEYIESNVTLPTIPEMSEWGLAGIQSSDTLACDEIDFVKGVYRKRINKVVFNGTENWWGGGTSSFFTRGVKPIVKKGSEQIINWNGFTCYYTGDNTFLLNNETSASVLYFRPTSLNITTIDAWKEYLAKNPLELYYELETPEEYPLPKIDNNYISSDYGVEQFDSAVPCNANNLYYMRSLAGETRNFLDRMYANTDKTDANDVADYITNGIEDNKQLATNAPNLALRALFVAAGAKYNDTDSVIEKIAPWGTEETWVKNNDGTYTYSEVPATVDHLPGHYYLNGLGDITEEQMMDIYKYSFPMLGSTDWTNAFREVNVRTNLFYKQYYSASRIKTLTAAFNANKTIEIIDFNNLGAKVVLNDAASWNYTFGSCAKLKRILGVLDINKASSLLGNDCDSLIHVQLYNLKTNLLLFNKSNNIDKESVLYAIQNASPTSAITITLHTDAYARLKDDADIVSALEAQPLITLVSA